MKTRSVRTSPLGGRQPGRCGQSHSHHVTTPAASTTGTYVLTTSDAPSACSHAHSAKTPIMTVG